MIPARTNVNIFVCILDRIGLNVVLEKPKDKYIQLEVKPLNLKGVEGTCNCN